MVDKIFTFDELDEMLIKEPRSDDYIQDNLMALEASMRELKNKRTHEKTLEDALDSYEGWVADARKIKERGLEGQVATFKSMGCSDTGNHAWNLPAHYSDALAVIADHEGPQEFRNLVLAGEYGLSLEDEYNPVVKAHNGTMAVLRKELADMRLEAQQEQAQRIYENELESIEGDD